MRLRYLSAHLQVPRDKIMKNHKGGNKYRLFHMKMVFLLTGLSLSFILTYTYISSAQDDTILPEKKRDPFVDLVDKDGKIKSREELVRPTEKILPLNILLKGIIWDEKRPLAIINNKVYAEGAKIFEGLILEKINKDSIILIDQGEKIKLDLRKKEKK